MELVIALLIIFVIWYIFKDRNEEVESNEVVHTPQDPQQVLKQTSNEILAGSFLFAKEFLQIGQHEYKLIASEVVYLCLSVADIHGHKILTPQKREEYLDLLTFHTLNNFILKTQNVGENQVEPFFNNMTKILQNRMSVYGQCTSFMGEVGLPSAGSQVFAFNYFVNRILNILDVQKFNVMDVLCGKENYTSEKSDAFPDPLQSVEWTAGIVPCIVELKLPENLKSIS